MSLVEEIADGGVGGRGLDVGSTTDIGKGWHANTNERVSPVSQRNHDRKSGHLPVESTRKVQSTNNGLQLGEAIDSLQAGVVCDQETTTNLGQRRE